MIDNFKLLKQGLQIYAVEDHRRDWRWLWLRHRTKRRLIFAGYAKSLSWSSSMYDSDRLSIDLESAEARLKLRPILVAQGPAQEEEAAS